MFWFFLLLVLPDFFFAKKKILFYVTYTYHLNIFCYVCVTF
jgi:hypothetical protein